MVKRNFQLTATRKSQEFSLMAEKGLNLRQLSQLLDKKSAIELVNMLIDDQGQLFTREGQQKKHEVASITGFTQSGHFHDDNFVVGYLSGSYGVVSVIDQANGTETVVKNTLALAPTSGVRYRDFFFIVNGRKGDKVHRIERTLAYDAQTANFTVGKVLTGGTSGATAKILSDVDAGTTGTLVLGDIQEGVNGAFTNNEPITDDNGTPGSATVNGTLGYQATEVTNAIKADIIHTFIADSGSIAGGRIFLGGIGDDESKVQFTATDDGNLLSFNDADDWTTTGTNANTGGEILNANAGGVNSLAKNPSVSGDQVVVGYVNGELRFRLTATDISGVLTKEIVIDYETLDQGWKKGAISTQFGVFYLANDGLHLLGKKDILSRNLGVNYFDDVTFDNAQIIHAPKERLIIATYAKDSSTNNETLWYNTQTGAIGLFENWLHNTYAEKDGDIFAGSAVSGKFYSIFDGFDDDGAGINYRFKQELSGQRLNSINALNKFYAQAVLFEGEAVDIDFDTIDIEGNEVLGALEKKITGVTPLTKLLAWGTASYGTAGWGSASGVSGSTSKAYAGDAVIPEYHRLFVTIKGDSQAPAVFNWFGLETRVIGELATNDVVDRAIAPAVLDALLKEDGGFLLKEDGGKIILE